jgi:N-formylglutamate amidohydrolase
VSCCFNRRAFGFRCLQELGPPKPLQLVCCTFAPEQSGLNERCFVLGVVSWEVAPTFGGSTAVAVAEEFGGLIRCCHHVKKHRGKSNTISHGIDNRRKPVTFPSVPKLLNSPSSALLQAENQVAAVNELHMKFDKIVIAIPHSVGKTNFADWDRPEVAKADSDRWTDWFTDKLFTPPQREGVVAVVGSVPRFDCDLERLPNDPLESAGMGILYNTSHSGARRLNSGEEFLHHWHDYRKAIVNELTPNSLLIDCHSFPSDVSDVDICIGINDDWSSPDKTTMNIVLQHFRDHKVAVNDPFCGSLTPEAGFSYKSLMIEVNKRLYLNEDSFTEFPFAYKLHNTICNLYGKLLAL